MVSGILAPLYSFWIKVGLKRDSGPDRGRSPVEWRVSVRSSVRSSVRPFVRSSVRLLPLFLRNGSLVFSDFLHEFRHS